MKLKQHCGRSLKCKENSIRFQLETIFYQNLLIINYCKYIDNSKYFVFSRNIDCLVIYKIAGRMLKVRSFTNFMFNECRISSLE